MLLLFVTDELWNLLDVVRKCCVHWCKNEPSSRFTYICTNVAVDAQDQSYSSPYKQRALPCKAAVLGL